MGAIPATELSDGTLFCLSDTACVQRVFLGEKWLHPGAMENNMGSHRAFTLLDCNLVLCGQHCQNRKCSKSNHATSAVAWIHLCLQLFRILWGASSIRYFGAVHYA